MIKRKKVFFIFYFLWHYSPLSLSILRLSLPNHHHCYRKECLGSILILVQSFFFLLFIFVFLMENPQLSFLHKLVLEKNKKKTQKNSLPKSVENFLYLKTFFKFLLSFCNFFFPSVFFPFLFSLLLAFPKSLIRLFFTCFSQPYPSTTTINKTNLAISIETLNLAGFVSF